MFRQIGWGEIIVIVVVLLFVFGAKKLPELARSIGRSATELRKGLREGAVEDIEDETAEGVTAAEVSKDSDLDSG